ncbi:phosphotransferase [Streptomyces sp. NPDC127033]|uniref:phosphotransferase n=1 Tax=Streptomyces sp. NPDC127033 TaxID=3347110 RepID=UPI003650DD31
MSSTPLKILSGDHESVVSTAVVTEPRMSEADVVRWATGLEVLPGSTLAPPVAVEGPGRPVLEKVPGPRFDARVQDRSVTVRQLRHVGLALATLHTTAPPADHPVTVESLPWDPLPLRVWAGLSSEQRRLTGALHRDAALRQRGREAHAALAERGVWCHGDARTNNIVLSGGLPLFIDWECAGLGRPEGDLGSLCGSLITDTLVLSEAPAGAEAHAELRASIDRATGQIRQVLAAYRHGNRQGLDAELLGSAVGCGLLARALMQAAQSGRERVAMALYRLGRGLVLDPGRWKAIDAHA